MSNKKQTAVEWYNEQLNLYGDMAFNKEITLGEYHINNQQRTNSEDYYNQTYGGN